MAKVILKKWEIPPMLKKCKFLKVRDTKTKEEKNYIYKAKLEKAVTEKGKDGEPYFEIINFLDKDLNVVEVNIEEVLKHEYIEKNPKEKTTKEKKEKKSKLTEEEIREKAREEFERQKIKSDEKKRLKKEEWIKKSKQRQREEVVDEVYGVLTRRGQIEEFWKEQPFFYDKSKIFWLWNKEIKMWDLSDEVDYLNSIQDVLGIDTIGSKARTELIAGFQQVGRKHKPKEIKKCWVQFRDKIYDIKTGEIFEATPEYFVKNPIPWDVGNSEETPTINKFFSEWVEEKYIKTLYEIIAYAICTDRFMQRIVALCGGGSNGKGTFIKLLTKFLGEDNCVSSEIKQLAENQFETAVLYGRLLCVMGEVSYGDLKNTNQVKKMAGEDKLSFQFKGKTPFTDENTTLGICLTNSMPITPDKSIGFYRKWMIVDFPNQFKEIKENLIDKIPEEEFKNLAKKSLRILGELYDNPIFTNEGDFENRARRYEERSNPVMKFVDEFCLEEAGAKLPLRDFTNECNKYLKEKHLRILTATQIGKILRNEGFSVGARTIDDVSTIVILNLKVKTIKTIKTIINPTSITHGNLMKNTIHSGSYNSSQRETESKIPKKTQKEIPEWSESDKKRLKKAEDKGK